jgi:anti-sigma regulatory factor (Ser/Thr protein kinase)
MAAPTPEPAPSVSLRLAFAPDPCGARDVSVATRNFLAEHGVPDAELFGYELCVAEASNNAIEYVRGSARKIKPVVVVKLTPSLIEIRVIDHTPGFTLPTHVAPPSPKSERGRGLFLIQTVMDELRYVRGASENVLIMLKRRYGAMRWEQTPGEAVLPRPIARRGEGPGAPEPLDLSAAHPGARSDAQAPARGKRPTSP